MYLRRHIRRFQDRLKYGRRKGQAKWRSLFAPYRGDEVVALDIETTSMDVKQAEILSIGAVIIKANRVKTSTGLAITIQAPANLPAESVKVHLLRRVDLADGLPLEEALRKLLEFVGNRPVLGYYIAYDLAVLDKSMRPLFGFGMPNRSIDIVSLFRRRLSARAMHDCEMKLGFDDIAKQLQIPVVGRHTALGDAITTALMYVQMKSGRG
ncbi:MAG: 3'-5' exonuclease [Gammaproteobacteria bacterium]|jgi:DNA polymerase-3 subunit epsilon|nr:3'-5' exonuclease [Gammaproteobacteria bacterium]